MAEREIPEVHHPETAWTWEADQQPFSELSPGPEAEAEAG